MPLEDFVSPIIKAYLQGQQLKRQKENDILRKQEAEDESKIRQLNAKKLEKDLANYDAVQALHLASLKNKNDADKLQSKIALAKAAENGDIPVETIHALRASVNGETPNVPGGIGLVDAVKHMVDYGGEKVEIMSPQQRQEMQIANAIKMNAPKLALAEGTAAIGDKYLEKSQTRQFGQQDKNREDTQAFQSEEAGKTRTHQETLQKMQETAAESLARFQAKEAMRRTIFSQGAATERTRMGLDAKNDVDAEDVEDIVENQLRTGFGTRQGMQALKKTGIAALLEAKRRGYQVLTDAQEKEILNLHQLGDVITKMERFAKDVGSGSLSANVPGTEMKARFNAMKGELGQLVRFHGDRGALSEGDVTRGLGLIPETWLASGDVKKLNDERLEDARKLQAKVLRHYYPKGTNPKQLFAIAEKFGIDKKYLQDEEKGNK